MADMSIPAGPKTLTPAWLTWALRSTGTITDAVVTSCTIEILGEGKGFTGQVARIGLDYDIEAASTPVSLIAKFPPLDPEVRAALNHYRIYEKEFRFYRDVAQDIALRTPRLYYSALNPASGESVLLLEDLAPAQTLNILEGCTAEDAAFTIRQLAAFHAAWWEHPRLRTMDWLPVFDEQAEDAQERYTQGWDVFLKKVSDLVPAAIVPLGAKLRDHLVAVKHYLGQHPQTFLHGDFHLNNLLFDSTQGQRRLTVIDWQVCFRGRAMRDLANFLVTALPPDRRRAHEMNLLKLYHAILTEHGVQGYPFDQCLYDYRFTMLDLLYFLVMVIVLLDFSVNEEAGMIRDMAVERFCTAILDHKAEELLEGLGGLGTGEQGSP
jgi:Ecdysteroid kinase-like family